MTCKLSPICRTGSHTDDPSIAAITHQTLSNGTNSNTKLFLRWLMSVSIIRSEYTNWRTVSPPSML